MMGIVIMSGIVPPLVAPITGILLSDIAEGSLVKLNESGSPVEFYVAKHDYESALNGTGRTLLVRKDCYDKRRWHSSNVNAYATSEIDTWLNNTYKALLDTDVQTAMGTTTFYYTPGNGNTNVATLSRSAFLLSYTELNRSFYMSNIEGTALPISEMLITPYLDGVASNQWTRTPYNYGTDTVLNISPTDILGGGPASTTSFGSRPCFTLPSNALFDTNTMFLKGVK